MAICPSCHAEMTLKEDDFGIVPCSNCGAMVFIDMDGQAQMYQEDGAGDEGLVPADQSTEEIYTETAESDEEYGADDGPEVPSYGAESNLEGQTYDSELAFDENSNDDIYAEGAEPAEAEFSEDWMGESSASGQSIADSSSEVIGEELPAEYTEDSNQFVGESEVVNEYVTEDTNDHAEGYAEEPAESPQTEMAPEEVADYDEDEPADGYDFDAPLVAEGEVVVEADEEYASPEDPLGDINSFGNETIEFDGPLAYNLTIRGIDTAEMRTYIQEALDDGRFLWNVEEIIEAIEGGELSLVGLNPVKASLVVNRVKALKVDIEWEQTSIQESE